MTTFTNKRTVLAALAGAVIVAGAALVSGRTVNAQSEGLQISTMHATYPVYGSLAELADESTLVVRGRVEQALPARRVLPNVPLESLPAEKRANAGYLTTDVVVRVSKVLAGRQDLAGQTVLVTHLGGQLGSERFVLEDEEISQPGGSYVLFLRDSGDGRFDIVGGNQGRFADRNGRIELVSQHAAGAPVPKQLRGMETKQFEAAFDRLVRESKGKRHEPAQPGADEPLGKTPSGNKPSLRPGADTPPVPGKA